MHYYDDAIAERKEEHLIKEVRLIGFQEKNLHFLNDYVTALQMILDINKGPLHVSLEHILIVYYIFFQKLFHFIFGKRKVLVKKPKPWKINLLLDLAYNGWCKIRDTILTKFGSTCKNIKYHMVIDLLDNIIPATLDVWKRHNYNKAPLAFLSDIFYWQDTNHPFAEAVKLFLINFNDYYVENIYSKIRSQIPVNSNVDYLYRRSNL
ncbi:unnamed protein product [Rhizophagus irregularis]|nr:unnamed protein product [Rhizophagus irregularis]